MTLRRSALPIRVAAALLLGGLATGCDRLGLQNLALPGSGTDPLRQLNSAADGPTQSTPLVTGQVVDERGTPVEMAKVRLYEGLFPALDGATQTTPFDGTTQTTPFDGPTQTTPFNGTVFGPQPDTRITTDAAGRFELRAPGRHVLAVEAWDWRHARAARLGIAIHPESARVDVGTLRLQPECAVVGRVVAPQGESVEGVAVFVPGTDHIARTDNSGAYLLSELPAEVSRVAAVRPGFKPAVSGTLSLLPGTTTTLPDLVLEVERPVLKSVVPAVAGPGAEVVLSGDGFGHTALRPVDVRFNRLKASQVTRLGDREIRAIVPSGALSGPVDVVVEGAVSEGLPFTAIATVSVSPSEVRLRGQEEPVFGVSAADDKGGEIPPSHLAWSVDPPDLGRIDPATGRFQPSRSGFGTLTVASGRVKARASLGFSTWRAQTAIGQADSNEARRGPIEGSSAEVRFYYPWALAAHPDGRLLFADLDPDVLLGQYGGRPLPLLRSLDGAGRVTIVAGTSAMGYDGDGQSLGTSRLTAIYPITVAPGKGIVVADGTRIRVVPEAAGSWLGRSLKPGFLYDVLGTGDAGPKNYGLPGTEGLPPLETSLLRPTAIAWDPRGQLVVASHYNQMGLFLGSALELGDDGSVRPILRSSGYVRMFSGTRADPDDFPGIPYSLVADADGNLFIGSSAHVWLLCRKAGTYFGVSAAAGDLVVIAGTGAFATRPEQFSGEEVPALKSNIWNVQGIGLLGNRLVLTDSGWGRIREIDERGIIRTLAGGGTEPEGPGLQARFRGLGTLSVGPDGSLYVRDSNRIVRLYR